MKQSTNLSSLSEEKIEALLRSHNVADVQIAVEMLVHTLGNIEAKKYIQSLKIIRDATFSKGFTPKWIHFENGDQFYIGYSCLDYHIYGR